MEEQKQHRFTGKIKTDRAYLTEIFSDCSDMKMKDMKIGRDKEISCFLVYIEITMSSVMFRTTAIGNFLVRLSDMDAGEIHEALAENALGLSDMTLYETAEEAAQGVLTGDAVFLVDGFDRAFKIPDKGYPGGVVKDVESEKVTRGSNEGFTDNIKINTALMRKRLQTPDLKIEQMQLGVRTNTLVNLIYMKGIVRPELLREIKKRLEDFEVDGILESGMVEQLTEEQWLSPFPQVQTTRRPDRAVMAVLEGKTVILVNNTPIGLILPADYNSFIRTTDDYYNRAEIASFSRLIRYIASFLAMSLPGLYLAVTNFHTQILPTTLLLSFAANRQGVPFPAVVEVLLMELSFELLREAGVRLPGTLGNTIGIVGGLIIGQAAVDANIVSPIVVIVVAFTALCSFSIPNDDFASAFRLLKFAVIGMSAWLGFYGFLLAMLAVLIHLSQLKSYGMPYLLPFVGAELNDYQDERDSLVRFPLFALKRRPINARKSQRIRFRRK